MDVKARGRITEGGLHVGRAAGRLQKGASMGRGSWLPEQLEGLGQQLGQPRGRTGLDGEQRRSPGLASQGLAGSEHTAS